MADFSRTDSGINNLHKFYKVEFVVYVEGGKSITIEDVEAGMFTSETEDVIFWENIFLVFKSGKKLKFKSVGSKSTVSKIAEGILEGRIYNTYAAMDNEFDEILSKRLNHPQILYTNGYAWENDVWNASVIKSIITNLTAVKIKGEEIEDNFNDFLKDIEIGVCADAFLFQYEDSFFPRKSGYLFCVDCTPINLPSVKKQELTDRLSKKALDVSLVTEYAKENNVNAHKLCFGHLLADYCCQVVIHYLKNKHSLKGVTRDIIYRMGLTHFFSNFNATGEVYKHYELQFLRPDIVAA